MAWAAGALVGFESQVKGPLQKIDDQAFCLPQGGGAYTFAMVVGLSTLGIPIFPFGGGDASIVGSTAFMILDGGCNLLALYDQPGCRTPHTAKEGFLQYVLTVTDTFADLDDPYFSFEYANGKYSIRNNHCVCGETDDSAFNSVSKRCRCAFPVAGESEKRAIDFKA